MNNRTLWGLVALGAVALLALGVIANQHRGNAVEPSSGAGRVAEAPEEHRPVEQVRQPLTAPTPAPAIEAPIADSNPPQTQPATRAVPGRPVRPAKFADAVADEQLTPQKVARVALSFVGQDPIAEQVWEAAINNPNFTPNERKDLIEDLNEEGFDDPKNLTAADAPMIVRRIQLIENLAPQAADDVNAAAFAEAYKDLVNMLAKVTKDQPHS